MICECLVQLSVVAELQGKAEVAASINSVLSGVHNGNTPSGLGDKPEWVQFSGITCNDRKKRTGSADREVGGELGGCVSEGNEALGGPEGPA